MLKKSNDFVLMLSDFEIPIQFSTWFSQWELTDTFTSENQNEKNLKFSQKWE
jgi:hypothetical protein